MIVRVYNFGAGPAAIPESVLQEAKQELLNWQEQGMSVMEVPHRGQAYLELKASLEQNIKTVLNIPNDYHILVLGFPARFQFAMIPMNFLKTKAFYLKTGYWSDMAYQDALLQGQATTSSELPHDLADYDYFYFVPNETLSGVSAKKPDGLTIPVIADATSTLFAHEFDISEYDLIFAGLQKNLGPAGLSLVIIKDDLLKQQQSVAVKLCDYQMQVEQGGMMATPPVFNIYMANLVVKWLIAEGGVSTLHQQNDAKAARLYDYIDSSDFYSNQVPVTKRSIHNITIELKDKTKLDPFLDAAEKKGLHGLKGHRKVGGIRVSLYNAVTMEAVNALLNHMQWFAGDNLK